MKRQRRHLAMHTTSSIIALALVLLQCLNTTTADPMRVVSSSNPTTTWDEEQRFTIVTALHKFVYPYRQTQIDAMASWERLPCKPNVLLIGKPKRCDHCQEYTATDRFKYLSMDARSTSLEEYLTKVSSIIKTEYAVLVNSTVMFAPSACHVFQDLAQRYQGEQLPILAAGRGRIYGDQFRMELHGNSSDVYQREFSMHDVAQDGPPRYFFVNPRVVKPPKPLKFMEGWMRWLWTHACNEFYKALDLTEVIGAFEDSLLIGHNLEGGRQNKEKIAENIKYASKSFLHEMFLSLECATDTVVYGWGDSKVQRKWRNENWPVYKGYYLKANNPAICEDIVRLKLAEQELVAFRKSSGLAEKENRLKKQNPLPTRATVKEFSKATMKTTILRALDATIYTSPQGSETGMSPRAKLPLMSNPMRLQNVALGHGNLYVFGENWFLPNDLHTLHFNSMLYGPASDGGERYEDPVIPVVLRHGDTFRDFCDHVVKTPTYMFPPLFISNIFHGLHDGVYPLWFTQGDDVSMDISIIIPDNGYSPLDDAVRGSPGFKFLQALSANPIYSAMDIAMSRKQFCFEDLTVGLDIRAAMQLLDDAAPKPLRTARNRVVMTGLKSFLLQSFQIPQWKTAMDIRPPGHKPQLTLISRVNSPNRVLKDEAKLVEAVEDTLGIEISVVCLEDMALEKQMEIMVETDILIGLHGAGLTNVFWLREGSALLQIVPNRVMATSWHTSFRRLGQSVGVTTFLDYEALSTDVEFDYDFLTPYIDYNIIVKYFSRQEVLLGPSQAFDFASDVVMRNFWLDQNVKMTPSDFLGQVSAAVKSWEAEQTRLHKEYEPKPLSKSSGSKSSK
eukprot:GFYU01004154.1.p1 GENE.GFYU01004154.1~~GFYU01004154.1.p1  ORF type:complete len:844 (-),score=168.68 GFYU01004154.1:121-2652(-)